MTTRLAQVLEKIDRINSEDPHRQIVDGTVRPKFERHVVKGILAGSWSATWGNAS